MAPRSCSGSSPWGLPARASDPCLASVGLLELELGLSSAACLLLLWNAGLEAWLPPAAGDGSFSAAPGKDQLLPQCPVQHPRLQPDKSQSRLGFCCSPSAAVTSQLPCPACFTSSLRWALTRTPRLAGWLSPPPLLSLWYLLLTLTALGLSPPRPAQRPAECGQYRGLISALTLVPLEDPDKAQ